MYWNDNLGGKMAKSGSLNKIPKIHTIRKSIANEIYHIVFSGKDRNFKKDTIKEIESWLAQGGFSYDETPADLAKEWQESVRDAY